MHPTLCALHKRLNLARCFPKVEIGEILHIHGPARRRRIPNCAFIHPDHLPRTCFLFGVQTSDGAIHRCTPAPASPGTTSGHLHSKRDHWAGVPKQGIWEVVVQIVERKIRIFVKGDQPVGQRSFERGHPELWARCPAGLRSVRHEVVPALASYLSTLR